MSSINRRHWSWLNCFALVKHNKKPRLQRIHQSNLQQFTSNGKHLQPIDENANILQTKNNSYSFIQMNEQCLLPSSCMIKVDAPTNEDTKHLIAEDNIQRITADDDLNSPIVNLNSSSILRPTQLDAIVEDSNEENSDDLEEMIQPTRLCCDRDIIDDSKDLYSRLFDLSKMTHVKTQLTENGNFLGEFTRQVEKLKIKTDDIIRASAQMPRDAELLEARYSTLLATIESLSMLLKIAQIPACRSLINRLIFSIEQRSEQLNKLVQLASMSLFNSQQQQRRDLYDDDFLSFRSALSSYEHLFTLPS